MSYLLLFVKFQVSNLRNTSGQFVLWYMGENVMSFFDPDLGDLAQFRICPRYSNALCLVLIS